MVVYRWALICTGVLLCLLCAHQAHAWGDTGHQIICAIAFQELNPQARAVVERLLQLDPDFQTFSRACIWPDHPRKRSAEHFVNLPRSAARLENDPCPLAAKCTVTAIAADHAALANTTLTDAKRLEALKYLGHWVGDVHQPLHVSFKDDKGGNDIEERGPCAQNLHAVWDSCIIARKLGTDIQAIAGELRSQVTSADRAQWNSTTPKEWANESFKITTSAEVEYCVQKNNACWYERNNRELDADEPKKFVTVNEAYLERHLPTIKQRLTQAGVRLAGLLNRVLGVE